MNVFVTIIVILKSASTLSNGQEYLNISRGSEGSVDVFQLPASLCGESKGARECPLMGGSKIAECQCACNMKDERGILYKNTFGFYNGEWNCQNNTTLRKNTGCLVLEEYGTKNHPIPVLDRSYKLFRLSKRKKPSSCRLNWIFRRIGMFVNSTYQGRCNGTWKRLDEDTIERTFRLRRFWWSYMALHYHVRRHHLLPAGRLIKLVFPCKSLTCFLLKTKGNFSCPVPYIATTSPPSTLATTALWISTSGTTKATNFSSTSNSATSGLFKTISTDVTTNLSTSTTRLRDSNAGRSTADNSFVIAGSASGVALIIVIGVTMLIIRRTCTGKNTARESEGTSRTDEDGNQEMHIYANPTSIQNTCTDDRLQRSIDSIPVAGYVNVQRSPDIVSDELEYEVLPFGESEACRQKDPSETLNSSVYCSLVPNVYGSLQVHHKTHVDDTDRQVTSRNNENTYQ